MKETKINSYVCELDNAQIDNLEGILKQKYWELKPFNYAHWQARKDKTTVTAYKSGKLTVQGKGTEELVLFILEPEILKIASLGYDDVDLKTGQIKSIDPHAGIDESGKGDFFGPLVIAAVYIDPESHEKLKKIGVKDSKAIKNDKRMSILANDIRNNVQGKFSIVAIGPEAYNRLYDKIGNLNRLLAWGHARALENLIEKVPECDSVIADKFGNASVLENALLNKGKKIKLEQRIKGEQDIAVAAASILARSEFVRRLTNIAEEYDQVFPKGANSRVEEAAVKFIKTQGQEKLPLVAKMHFRTALKVKELAS